MRAPQHPLSWPAAVRPADLNAVDMRLVHRGARASGARADALVVLDDQELTRRAEHGPLAVTSLPVLDALMNLPWQQPVRVDDLTTRSRRLLETAPHGAVEHEAGWVTRLLTPPLTVIATVIAGSAWQTAISRARHFGPFSQQIILLPSLPRRRDDVLWEAAVSGVGVWVGDSVATAAEVAPPQPFVRQYFKPATWRFAERALLSVWATATDRPGLSVGSSARRQPHTCDAKADQLRLSS